VSPPRVAPGGLRQLGLVNWAICRLAGRATRTGPPNLFTTLGRHRRLFRGWLRFAGRLMPGGKLPRRETELAILRVAHRRGCDYELAHHVRMGRRAGLGDAELAAVAADGDPEAACFSARERALLAAADELHAGDLGDATWERLRQSFSEREAIELCLLVGHYEMLATTISALRIEPDLPSAGTGARGG
jgi:AhpD family alkylhydroperoxidase